MSNNLFGTLIYSVIAIAFIVAKVLDKSVLTKEKTAFYVFFFIILALVFFIKYKRERKDKQE